MPVCVCQCGAKASSAPRLAVDTPLSAPPANRIAPFPRRRGVCLCATTVSHARLSVGLPGKTCPFTPPPCPPTPPPSSPTPTPPPPSPAITPHPTTKSLLVTPTLQQYVVSSVDRTLAVHPGATASRHPSHSADNAISTCFFVLLRIATGYSMKEQLSLTKQQLELVLWIGAAYANLPRSYFD